MSATGNHPRPAPSAAWPGSTRAPRRVPARWREHALGAALARWHAGTLDRELASGATAGPGEVLVRRAHQLTSGRNRRRLAAGLERAQRDSERTGFVFSTVVAPDRHEVWGARVVFGALERRLRGGEPIQARAAAMLQVLLTDGNGPLYRPVGAGSLGSQLRAAAVALGPDVR